MKVLILGGYGGFGARLSRRLAADGWQVLVAGRNKSAASAVAAKLQNASAVVTDRRGDLVTVLRRERPFLLIDAAGPFQGDDGRVIRACIAERVHYIDLADARDFVSAVGAFDAEAIQANVSVISGASSVPALSGAVVAELAEGMAAVHSIEMSISASNRASAGASVARAILSYVGQPLILWRGRRWVKAYGWQMLRRETYEVEGETPIRRLVALADVPDHSIFPETIPGRPAAIFYAGPELAFQTLTLWLMSWLVRWRWLPSLLGLSKWLLPLQGLTGFLGSDRSAVKIEVKGANGDGLERRSWTLIANRGDGPEIPTLAAQLIARELRDGQIAAGARHAGGLLGLEAFRGELSRLAIHEQVSRASIEPLYQRVMGDRFRHLPGAVLQMHSIIGDAGASGTASVMRGSSPLVRIIARFMGFPPAGDHQVHVTFAERDGVETWTRDFSGHEFESQLSRDDRGLIERFGPLRFRFDLHSSELGLQMVLLGWSIFNVPLPVILAPRIHAIEGGEGADFLFDVSISLPLGGPLVHYRGRLCRL